MSRVKLLFMLIMFFLVFTYGQYVRCEDTNITLSEAISIALSDNPTLGASRFENMSLKEDVTIRKRSLWPNITLKENFIHTDKSTNYYMFIMDQERFSQKDFSLENLNNPDTIENFQTDIVLEMPVFAKKAYVAIDMAKTASKGKEYELKMLEDKVVLDVFRAYIGVKIADGYVSVSEKAIEDTKEHLRIAQVLYENGTGLYSDVLRAEVAVAGANQRLVTTKKNLALAKRQLGLIMGQDKSYGIVDEEVALALSDYEYYANNATERADVLSMEKNYENAKNMVRMSRADYYPTVGIMASYQFNDHDWPFGTEGEGYTVGAFMQLKLFDGFKREHETKKAKYKVKQTREHLKGLKNKVKFDIYGAYLTVKESEDMLNIAKDTVKVATEGLRLVQKRYNNSLANFVALLDAQTALDKSRADVVKIEGQFLTALAELEFVSGTVSNVLGNKKSGGKQL